MKCQNPEAVRSQQTDYQQEVAPLWAYRWREWWSLVTALASNPQIPRGFRESWVTP